MSTSLLETWPQVAYGLQTLQSEQEGGSSPARIRQILEEPVRVMQDTFKREWSTQELRAKDISPPLFQLCAEASTLLDAWTRDQGEQKNVDLLLTRLTSLGSALYQEQLRQEPADTDSLTKPMLRQLKHREPPEEMHEPLIGGSHAMVQPFPSPCCCTIL